MEKRFHALRFIGTLYKIIGIIVLVLAVLGAVGIFLGGVFGGAAINDFGNSFGRGMSGMGFLGGIIGGLISGTIFLIASGIGGLTLYALGEAIYLLISIEENTRSAAEKAAKAVVAAEPAPPV